MKENKKNPLPLLAALILSCAAVYGIYRLLLQFVFPLYVLIIYTVLTTLCVIVYIIYNRGFSRKGVTVDMLPDSWSEEKKSEFISDGERRLKKSKPLLVAILAFFFTFVLDALEIIVLPFFMNIFTK